MSNMITAKEFVAKVQALEGVVIALWCTEAKLVLDYDYINKADHTSTIKEWLHRRVLNKLSGTTVRVIDGNYCSPHRGTSMKTLRNSYKSKDEVLLEPKVKKATKLVNAKLMVANAPKGLDPSLNLDFLNTSRVH